MVVRKTCLPMSFLNLAVLFINFVSFSLDDVSDLSVENMVSQKKIPMFSDSKHTSV